jgi:hypothetical protein
MDKGIRGTYTKCILTNRCNHHDLTRNRLVAINRIRDSDRRYTNDLNPREPEAKHNDDFPRPLPIVADSDDLFTPVSTTPLHISSFPPRTERKKERRENAQSAQSAPPR